MNRLVIVGNGFDLAHGLPTSYRDFIDDFWKNFKDYCKNEAYQELVYTNIGYDRYYTSYKPIKNFEDFKSNIVAYCMDYPECHFEEKSLFFYTSKFQFDKKESIFEFKNDFFKEINKRNSENWVDIENEYYRQLKLIVKDDLTGTPNDLERKNFENGRKKRLEKLNNEFEQIKNLLENYLKDKVINKFIFQEYPDSTGNFFKFHNIFFPELLTNDKIQISKYLELFSKNDREQIENVISKKELKIKIHFLTFNYTPTLNKYYEYLKGNPEIEVGINYIHGLVGNTNDNKINFGFGDEMDNDYKLIENIDDNEYLKNFKSFQYFQNSNYKRLLDFTESEKFEVFIMGSSCGLSDRTLLNSIFENENCRLIKIFYYKNGQNDNFTELTQNISRHFNKKALMRLKIVHKSDKQIMPSYKLPEKK
ncbi:AbiH family protein [Flavobacterium sp.]|uniref:AbiH family protein n=1 Tax=Flavobacterium sp. TaxID=239 RepID=UPI0037517020